MKNLLTILALTTSIALPAFAETPKAVCTAEVKVNGLVCDFCARALEKVFGKQESVSGIDINLDDGLVKVMFNSDKTLDDDTLTKLITDSGYNVTQIDRGC